MAVQLALLLTAVLAFGCASLYLSHRTKALRVLGAESRLTMALIVLLAGLVGTLSPGIEVSAVAATATPSRAPEAAAANPETFVAGPANRQPVGGPPPAAALAAARSETRTKQELPARRTASSRTYKDARGYVTEIYPGAINYQATNGAWLPIDNTLVASHQAGVGYQNKGNSYSVFLPADAGVVRFATASGYVEFSLAGAAGKSSVSSDTATYRNALPGVDLAYSAQNEGVKETLTLASPASPHVFNYALQTSAGLAARANPSHGIDFVDTTGTVQFAFAPPFMYESQAPNGPTGSASLQLGGTASQQTVTLALDEAWLANPARHWPVVVDPTITYGTVGSAIWKQFNGANQDCYLQNGSGASTSYCNGSSLYAGYSSSVIDRALLQFNVQTSIPQDVTVLDADLASYLYASASGSAVSVDAMQLTQAWTTAATWNAYDGAHAWTNAGGTFASPAAWTDTSVGTGSGYYHWYLAQLVQKWIYGTVANDGILLKATSEATTNKLSFRSSEYSNSAYWPYLKVTYQLGIGDKPSDQSVAQKLTDRLSLQVDLSSGNLLVKHAEQAVRGTGLDQNVGLYYNNLSPAVWDYGRSWEISTGWDVWLATNHPDGVNFYGPSGTAVHFVKNSDGSFTGPPGLDATLVRNGDQTYTITFNANQEKYNFSTDGLSFLSDVDKNGNRISFSYNASGSLASMTDTQGRVTTFGYVAASGCTPPTSDGFVSTMTDPSGRKFQYGYDSNCNLTTLTDAANKVTHIGYDASFNLTQITDPNGNVTKLAYDGATRVTSIIRVTNVGLGTGPTTTYGYNTGAGNCAAAPPGDSLYGYTVATDPNSHAATYCYDQQGLVLQVVDPNTNSTMSSYTADQHVAAVTDPLSQTTTATYNPNNDLTKVIAPVLGSGHSAAATTASFQTPSTVAGYLYLPSSQADAQGNCSAFAYDAAGNQTDSYVGQTTPCDGLTGGGHTGLKYQGDPGISCGAKAGEQCSTTDALGNSTNYGYDANGNLTSVTRPNPLGATTVTVDPVSRVSSETDGKGQKTSYSYDQLDRVTQILFNGAITCMPSTGNCISYIYDGDGNQTSMTDNTGTTSYYYDSLNRLTTEALPDTSANCAGSSPAGITLSYDGASNVTQYCDSGGAVTYSYDAGNRLVSMAEPSGNCGPSPSLCTTFTYNPDGERTKTTFPGMATLNVGYDSNRNISSVVGKDKNGTVLTSFIYTYSIGNTDTQLRQTITESDPVASNAYTNSYDALNRLTQAAITAGSGTTYTYSYDSNGNMTRKIAGSSTTSYAFNFANELCWAYSGSSSNSCASAPTGATTYSFDSNGNQSSSSTGGSFSYNSEDQTTAITYGGVTLSPLIYSGTGQTQRTGAGSTSFDSGPSGVQLSTSGGSSISYLRDNQGSLIGERIGTNHYYYLSDGVGSITAVASGDGLAIGDRYGYDPYGNTTYHSGTTVNPWGYAGGYTDSTGLIKFGARFYDPTIARWTQVDPSASAQLGVGCSPNQFTYAGDNPTNSSDPSGFCNWGLFLWGMWHIVEAVAWAASTGALQWWLYGAMLADFGWNWAVFISLIFVAVRMIPVWFAGYWLFREGVSDIKNSGCFWWVLWWLVTR
jgi:RHS repeat-associated protein